MMVGRWRLALLALLALLTPVGACNPWGQEHALDPRSCDPRCPSGQRCLHGTCMTLDGGVNLMCGNGTIEASEGEVCEAGQLGGKTCASFGLPQGELRCAGDCRSFDRSRCRGCDETWCTVPAGTFTMGSPPSEPCREASGIKERAHQVTLTHAFQMHRGEVPRWGYVMAAHKDPSVTTCDTSCPVETVTWHHAASFCNMLSLESALKRCYTCMLKGTEVDCTEVGDYAGDAIYRCPGFRLPTEAEWERAYRGDTSSAYPGGANDAAYCTDEQRSEPSLDPSGWYRANAAGRPHPGARKQANPFGLYDLGGNVAEWCHDYFQNDLGAAPVTDPVGKASAGAPTRVVRGGSWDSLAQELRAAARETPNTDRSSRLGFRCVRTLDP